MEQTGGVFPACFRHKCGSLGGSLRLIFPLFSQRMVIERVSLCTNLPKNGDRTRLMVYLSYPGVYKGYILPSLGAWEAVIDHYSSLPGCLGGCYSPISLPPWVSGRLLFTIKPSLPGCLGGCYSPLTLLPWVPGRLLFTVNPPFPGCLGGIYEVYTPLRVASLGENKVVYTPQGSLPG